MHQVAVDHPVAGEAVDDTGIFHNDSAVADAAAPAEQGDVSRLGRGVDPVGVGLHYPEVALLLLVLVPVVGVFARVDRGGDASGRVDLRQEHAAVDAGALHPGVVDPGRAQPGDGLLDHRLALGLLEGVQIATVGAGIQGQPRNRFALLNFARQVACWRSHPGTMLKVSPRAGTAGRGSAVSIRSPV